MAEDKAVGDKKSMLQVLSECATFSNRSNHRLTTGGSRAGVVEVLMSRVSNWMNVPFGAALNRHYAGGTRNKSTQENSTMIRLCAVGNYYWPSIPTVPEFGAGDSVLG